MLLNTMRHVNEAATFAARLGFYSKVFSQPSIHKLAYREIRNRFGLSAQLAVRAIGKAVEAFANDKTVCPKFREDGAITYDQRNMSFKGVDKVSLSTLSGREIIGMVYGEYQRERFDRIKGQCDLVRRDGVFYLFATVDFPEPPAIAVHDFIGVDLGIVQIAMTDDGESFSGQPVEKSRRRNARAKKTYQKRNTRSARRRLRKFGKRQSRFQRDVNHCISKKIVAKALGLGVGIAVENLDGVGTRIRATVRRSQRSRMGNWGFFQLRNFLTYKARFFGVPIVAVDPRYTSQTCSACGHRERANRKSQSEFCCKHCGLSINADQNGARNIRSCALGATVNGPDLAASPR